MKNWLIWSMLAANPGTGRDRFLDFVKGVDLIDLSGDRALSLSARG